MSSAGENSARPPKKLRSACDSCHQIKVRCTGGSPCQTCQNLAMECVYSVSNRIGRPRGTKNKKTLRRLSVDDNPSGGVEAKSDDSASASTSAASLKRPTEIGPAAAAGGVAASRWQDASLINPFTANLSHEIDAMSRLTLPPSDARGLEPDDAALWTMAFDGVCDPVPMDTPPSLGLQLPAPSTTFGSPMDSLAMQGIRQEMASFLSTPPTSATSSDGSTWHANSPHRFERPIGPFSTGSGSRVPSDGRESTDTEPAGLARSYTNDPSQTCSCLRWHAELLCRFKEIQASSQPRVDVLLVTAKEAIETWQTFLQCTHCQDGDDQEALLLSTMCLRILIQTTRGLGLRSGAMSGSAPPSRERDPMYDDKPKRGANDACYAPELTPGPERAGTQPKRTSLGMYEITGPDQTVVITALLCRMLAQIKTVLGDFKRRTESGLWNEHRRQGPARRERSSFDAEAKRRRVVVDQEEPDETRGDGSDEDELDSDYHHDAMHLLGLLKGLENQVKVLRKRLQDPPVSPSTAS